MEFRILFIYIASLWTWAFIVLKIAGSLNSPTPSVCQQSDVPSLSQKYGVTQFNETFYLNKWQDYEPFIRRLRGKKELRYRFSHGNISVLHPEEKRPTKFFDVILKVNKSIPTSSVVTLRIRQDNLYLVGFKNASDQWLEFNDFYPNNLILESIFLDFKGNYDSLENKAYDRKKILLGREQLKQAVIDLANSIDTQIRAKGLIIVIQMISESMRYRSISKFLSNIDASGKRPPTCVLAQQNSWGKISRELLRSDEYHTFEPQMYDPQTGITSEEDAVKAIGMIKYFKFSRINGCNMEANNEGEYPQAYPMVEVA